MCIRHTKPSFQQTYVLEVFLSTWFTHNVTQEDRLLKNWGEISKIGDLAKGSNGDSSPMDTSIFPLENFQNKPVRCSTQSYFIEKEKNQMHLRKHIEKHTQG